MDEPNAQGLAPAQRGSMAYAGAGAVGGASVAAGIFSALGLAKILANTDGTYTPGYPVTVFGMVALFILVSAIMLAPVSRIGARFAWAGIITFALLTGVGASILYMQSWKSPTAYLTETFSPDPADFSDISTDKMQLSLQYRRGRGSTKFEPLGDQRIPVSGEDFVDLRLIGLDKLEAAYLEKYKEYQVYQTELQQACKGVSNDVCFMVNARMGAEQ